MYAVDLEIYPEISSGLWNYYNFENLKFIINPVARRMIEEYDCE